MDQAKSVTDAVAYLVAAGAAAIQDTQDSRSPSKVTRSLGIDFSEGYELGISDNEDDVQETAEGWMVVFETGLHPLHRYRWMWRLQDRSFPP